MVPPICQSISSASQALLVAMTALTVILKLGPQCYATAAASYSHPSISRLAFLDLQDITLDLLGPESEHLQLKPHNVWTDNQRYKRSVDEKQQIIDPSVASKRLKFTALDQKFDLKVTPVGSRSLATNFAAYTIDEHNRIRPLQVDPTQFLEGTVTGLPDSSVRLHMESNSEKHKAGLLTGTILINGTQYIVEPSWRHANAIQGVSPELISGKNTMIVYKSSDIVEPWNQSPGSNSTSYESTSPPSPIVNVKDYLDYLDGPEVPIEEFKNSSLGNDAGRHKRQVFFEDIGTPTPPRFKRCSLKLVSDFWFYDANGGQNEKTTMNYMIALIDRINEIYTKTVFRNSDEQDGFDDMGFVIQRIVIHTAKTKPVRTEKDQIAIEEGRLHPHYNEDLNWDQRDFLAAFSVNNYHRYPIDTSNDMVDSYDADLGMNDGLENFCLAHLFTHRRFTTSVVLGLAYIASIRPNKAGGICSIPYPRHTVNPIMYYNTGFSTTKDTKGTHIPSRMTDLVTAHELGHNWGAEHDPDSDECSPKARRGGPYLMQTFAVSGLESNNKFFSPCSIRSIKAVLESKSDSCFINPPKTHCGNGIVEPEAGEQCDSGLAALSRVRDQCCDMKTCTIKPGYECSDVNDACCTRCMIASPGILCRSADPATCKQPSMCSGFDHKCPDPKSSPDGTTCQDEGKCYAGECRSICEARPRDPITRRGYLPCLCDSEADGCKRCCRLDKFNSSCLPINDDPLPDGTFCRTGYCERGKCKRQHADFVERFWDIIEEVDVNRFLRFMKDNIVLLVCLTTGVFWLPISIYITILDRRRIQEIREKDEAKKRRKYRVNNKPQGHSSGSYNLRPPSGASTASSAASSGPHPDENCFQSRARVPSAVSIDPSNGRLSMPSGGQRITTTAEVQRYIDDSS